MTPSSMHAALETSSPLRLLSSVDRLPLGIRFALMIVEESALRDAKRMAGHNCKGDEVSQLISIMD